MTPEPVSCEGLKEALYEAQSAVTAWQGIFEGLEAHLMDRVAMKDEANPEAYLSILRSYVANIIRDSQAICNSRWADYRRHEARALAAEAALEQAKGALASLPTDAEYRAMAENLRDDYDTCLRWKPKVADWLDRIVAVRLSVLGDGKGASSSALVSDSGRGTTASPTPSAEGL